MDFGCCRIFRQLSLSMLSKFSSNWINRFHRFRDWNIQTWDYIMNPFFSRKSKMNVVEFFELAYLFKRAVGTGGTFGNVLKRKMEVLVFI